MSSLLERAYASLASEHFSEALEAFSEYFQHQPLEGQNPLLIRDFANQLAMNGQPDRAIELLDQALSLHPNFAEFQVSRGQALLHSGRRTEARDDFVSAVLSDPSIRCQVYTLAFVLTLEQGDLDRLPPLLELALRFHVDSVDAEFQLAWANCLFESDFRRNPWDIQEATKQSLARAVSVVDALPREAGQSLPNHVYREAARLIDLHEFQSRGLPIAASCRFDDAACNNAAVVMLIKDEGDIIYQHLLWHYRLGLRRFAILNNGSTDNTLSLILKFRADFPSAQVYVIDDPEVAYYQGKKTTAAACFAKSIFDVEWILPLDGDEILTPTSDCLASTLANIAEAGFTYVAVHRCDYRLTAVDDLSDDNPLNRLKHRQRFLTPCPKVMIRFSPDMAIDVGNHDFSTDRKVTLRGASGLRHGLSIRHFPIRSRDHVRAKIVNGGKALEAATELGLNHGSHWRMAFDAFKSRGEEFIESYYQGHISSPDTLDFDPLPV
jgi:hypothetical protein